MKKQRGWQTGERVPSVLWRLRLAAGWSVALLDPNLSQISLRRRSTAAHLLVRRSVAMYCNRSWVLLALLHSASHCCTLLHSTSLRRFVCKECPSASPFNIVPPKPAQEICAHCNVFVWTVYSIARSVGIFRHITDFLVIQGKRQELQTGQK